MHSNRMLLAEKLNFRDSIEIIIDCYLDLPITDSRMNDCQVKKRSERRKHCALAVVRRNPKISPRRRPLPGAQDSQNLISWRWSLPSPQTQFGEGRCMQFPVIVIRDPHSHTNTQTGPITIHCAAKLSSQCKYHYIARARQQLLELQPKNANNLKYVNL